MHIESTKPIIDRLRRCRGQLQKVEEQIAGGASCTEVIPQFLAVKGSVDAATVAYIKQAMAECQQNATPEEMVNLLEIVVRKL